MKRQQSGFALIAAIILISVLAALAAFVASMVSSAGGNEQMSRASRVAELAADTGLEWGAYRVLRATPAPLCAATTVLPALAAYPGVRITVACTASPTTEPAVPGPGVVSVYAITATATTGAAPSSEDYAERSRSGVFSR